MRYYKLIYDFENDDDFIGCIVPKELNLDQYIVCEGNYIDEWDNSIRFDFNPDEGDEETDYLANSFGWLIFSDEFKKQLSCLVNDSIQYLEISIRNKKNNINLNGYRVANVITVLDALNLENSKYDLFELDEEKILLVEKYALKNDVIKNHHIFKLKGDTIPTFVSEQFKNQVEENNLTGFKFLEVKVVAL